MYMVLFLFIFGLIVGLIVGWLVGCLFGTPFGDVLLLILLDIRLFLSGNKYFQQSVYFLVHNYEKFSDKCVIFCIYSITCIFPEILELMFCFSMLATRHRLRQPDKRWLAG